MTTPTLPLKAIPWYRSPVYVSTLTQILSMVVVGLGVQTVVPIEAINGIVQASFVGVGLIAGLVAERKRRKSDIQPLTLSAADAEIFTNPPG